MPLGTMAAVMLIIALFTGLLPETLEKLKTGRFPVLAVLILAPVLRMAALEFTPELELNVGALFIAAVLFAAAARVDARRLLLPAALALLAAIPALLIRRSLEPDPAVLAAALLAVPAFLLLRSLPGTLLFAALTPVFTAVWRLITGLIGGYGVLELTGADLDVQLMGALFALFAAELRRFNRRETNKNAPKQTDPPLFFNDFRS